MKNKAKYLIKSCLVVCVFLFTASCDLEVQEKFNFDAQVGELPTFENMTAWEWIQTNPQGEFDYLIEAITITGLQEIYNDNSTQRTFILLKNDAWTANNELLIALTESAETPLEDIEVERLANALKYHVVDTYVDQGPEELKKLDQWYKFNTLLPGESGTMSFKRIWNQRLELNGDATLPSTKKFVNGLQHNYIFSNGVGHLSAKYTRLRPF